MATESTIGIEEGLDPANWEEMRALGHRMVDDLIAFHAGLSARPAWQPVSTEARRVIDEPPTSAGIGAEATYDAFREFIAEYPYGNLHPRAWGWVNGTGTTLAAFAEMWASGMNSNCWGGEQSASYVEAAVLDWFKQLFGFPENATGLLVSGGSEANLIGIAAGREAATKGAISSCGARALDYQLVNYASEQAHNSVDKAASLLGIGWDNLRHIPTTASYEMDVNDLRRAIAKDRAAGHLPACVVATAGTVNTGATDPLGEIADLCAEEGIWLHVDGAFGALATQSESLRPLLAGLERADSIAFDLHKWLYMPIEAGCVLVRSGEWQRRPFSPPAAYLSRFERGVASGPYNFSTLGPQLTRGFRALKVWMSMHAHGTAVYARLVEQNVQQARYLEERVNSEPRLELLAPVPLNVVCFRYRGANDDGQLNALNQELLVRLQESGRVVPSSTVLEGRFALRVAFTNHRTRLADIDELVAASLEIGASIPSAQLQA